MFTAEENIIATLLIYTRLCCYNNKQKTDTYVDMGSKYNTGISEDYKMNIECKSLYLLDK